MPSTFLKIDLINLMDLSTNSTMEDEAMLQKDEEGDYWFHMAVYLVIIPGFVFSASFLSWLFCCGAHRWVTSYCIPYLHTCPQVVVLHPNLHGQRHLHAGKLGHEGHRIFRCDQALRLPVWPPGLPANLNSVILLLLIR